jgi:hypothetical protein
MAPIPVALTRGIEVASAYGDRGTFPVVLEGISSKFLFDTGSSYTEVWKRRKSRDKIKSTLTLKDTKANGKEYAFDFLPSTDLKIDKIHWKNIAMASSDGLSEHNELDGSLGGNVLEDYVVTINFKNRLLCLDSFYHPYFTKKSTEIPMIIRGHKPYCLVKIDEKTSCLALLDTGCCINIAPDSLLSPEIVKTLRYQDEISGPWLGNLKSEKVKLEKIILNNLSIQSPSVYVFKS